jgi:hypothetical protein
MGGSWIEGRAGRGWRAKRLASGVGESGKDGACEASSRCGRKDRTENPEPRVGWADRRRSNDTMCYRHFLMKGSVRDRCRCGVLRAGLCLLRPSRTYFPRNSN